MPAPAQQAVQGTVIGTGSLIAPGGQIGLQGYTGAMGDGMPVGTVYAFTSATPPVGSMLCDGSAISRTTYPALFNLFGTQFGTGDGATTFNLPDLRSRFILGQGQGSGLTNRILAATGGEEAHVLILAEIASHTHGLGGHYHNMDHYHNWNAQGSHAHGTSGLNHAVIPSGSGGGSYDFMFTGSNGSPYNPATSAANIPAGNTHYASSTNVAWANKGGPSGGSDAAGSDTAHNNVPPYLVLVYMIKVAAGSGPSNQAPLADTTQPGLLTKVSGVTTDYIGGDNATHPLPAFPTSGFISKTAAYTLTPADNNKYIICSGGSWTLSLPTATQSYVWNVRNDQGLVASGTITITPAAPATIDGQTSLALLPGQMCTLYCDGTNYRSFGLDRIVVLGNQDITSSVANSVVLLPVGYRTFELEWTGVKTSVTGPASICAYFSTDGGSTWISTNYYWSYIYTASASATGASGATGPQTYAYLGWPVDAGTRGQIRTSLCPGGLNRMPSWVSQSQSYAGSSGYAGEMTASGWYNVQTQINALQYYINGGNLVQSYLTVKGIV